MVVAPLDPVVSCRSFDGPDGGQACLALADGLLHLRTTRILSPVSFS